MTITTTYDVGDTVQTIRPTGTLIQYKITEIQITVFKGKDPLVMYKGDIYGKFDWELTLVKKGDAE